MVTGNKKKQGELDWQWSQFNDLSLRQWYAITRLREAVFVVEQDCAYQDADGLDPHAWHLCGWDAYQLAAYLRLLPPTHASHPEIPAAGSNKITAIGRVVMAPAYRGQQLGRALMQKGIEGALTRYPDARLQVSAQAHLSDFYASLGFSAVTPVFDEDGIPHVGMHYR